MLETIISISIEGNPASYMRGYKSLLASVFHLTLHCNLSNLITLNYNSSLSFRNLIIIARTIHSITQIFSPLIIIAL